jgi:hypothetical protein
MLKKDYGEPTLLITELMAICRISLYVREINYVMSNITVQLHIVF